MDDNPYDLIQPQASAPSGVDMTSYVPAVISVESGGNPNAVSAKGALGPMQVMPATAADPGFGVAPARDNSAAENIRVGSQLLNAFGARYNNPALALAAYNAGPKAVDTALAQSGGDPSAAIKLLPPETQNYVPSVMGQHAATTGANPYDLIQPQATQPPAASSVAIANPYDLIQPHPQQAAQPPAPNPYAGVAKTVGGWEQSLNSALGNAAQAVAGGANGRWPMGIAAQNAADAHDADSDATYSGPLGAFAADAAAIRPLANQGYNSPTERAVIDPVAAGASGLAGAIDTAAAGALKIAGGITAYSPQNLAIEALTGQHPQDQLFAASDALNSGAHEISNSQIAQTHPFATKVGDLAGTLGTFFAMPEMEGAQLPGAAESAISRLFASPRGQAWAASAAENAMANAPRAMASAALPASAEASVRQQQGMDPWKVAALEGTDIAGGTLGATLPVSLPGGWIARAATGFLSQQAVGKAQQAVEHAIAPDQVQAPTMGVDLGDPGTYLGAAMGLLSGKGSNSIGEVPTGVLEATLDNRSATEAQKDAAFNEIGFRNAVRQVVADATNGRPQVAQTNPASNFTTTDQLTNIVNSRIAELTAKTGAPSTPAPTFRYVNGKLVASNAVDAGGNIATITPEEKAELDFLNANKNDLSTIANAYGIGIRDAVQSPQGAQTGLTAAQQAKQVRDQRRAEALSAIPYGDLSGRQYVVNNPVGGGDPLPVKVIVGNDGSVGLIHPDGLVDVTNMIKAGFPIKKAISMSFGDSYPGFNMDAVDDVTPNQEAPNGTQPSPVSAGDVLGVERQAGPSGPTVPPDAAGVPRGTGVQPDAEDQPATGNAAAQDSPDADGRQQPVLGSVYDALRAISDQATGAGDAAEEPTPVESVRDVRPPPAASDIPSVSDGGQAGSDSPGAAGHEGVAGAGQREEAGQPVGDAGAVHVANDGTTEQATPKVDAPTYSARQSAPAGRGLSDDEVNEVIRRVVGGKPDNIVVTDRDGLPPEVKQHMADNHISPDSVDAVHWNGKSYLIGDALHSPADVERLLFHEHYTHFGLRSKFDNRLNDKLDELTRGVGGMDGITRLAAKQGIDIRHYFNPSDPARVNNRRMMEELMAHASATTGTLRRKIEEYVGALRDLLRRRGFPGLSKLGITDLAHVMRQAREAAIEKTRGASGEPMYQRRDGRSPDDAAYQRAVELHQQIVQQDGAAKYPISGAKEMPDIANDIDPKLQAGDWRQPTAKERNGQQGLQAVSDVQMPTGDRARIMYLGNGRIAIDASQLKSGKSYGSMLYHLAANYAHNKDMQFVGDPAGITHEAILRRTEHMLNSALRFGTTRHLEPHPHQLNPEHPDSEARGQGVVPLKWEDGNDAANKANLLRTSYENVAKNVPAIKDLRYNFDTGKFERIDGHPLASDWFLRTAADPSSGAGKAGAGGNTLKRAVLEQSLLSRVVPGSRPGIGDEVLAHNARFGGAQRLSQTDIEGISYSRRAVPAQADHPQADQLDAIASGDRDRIAQAMSDFSGKPWTPAMVDAHRGALDALLQHPEAQAYLHAKSAQDAATAPRSAQEGVQPQKVETTAQDNEPHGASNAATAYWRDKLGLPAEQASHGDAADDVVHQEALKRYQADPTIADRIAGQYWKDRRPPTAEEQHILKFAQADAERDYMRAQSDHDAAAKAGDTQKTIAAKFNTDLLKDRMDMLHKTNQAAGTSASSAFRARQFDTDGGLIHESDVFAQAKALRDAAGKRELSPDEIARLRKAIKGANDAFGKKVEADTAARRTRKAKVEPQVEAAASSEYDKAKSRALAMLAKTREASAAHEGALVYSRRSEPDTIKGAIQAMAKEVIKMGHNDPHDVVSKIHGDLGGDASGLTHEDIANHLSGYGTVRQSTKQEVSARLAEVKRILKAEATTPQDKQTATNKARITRYQNLQAELERKLREGNFAPNQRAKIPFDDAAYQAHKNWRAAKAKVDQELQRIRDADMSWPTRFGMHVANFARAMKFLSPTILTKLTSVAAQRTVLTPAQMIMGSVLREIPGLRDIYARAAIHGQGFVLGAELEALRQQFSMRSLNDTWSRAWAGHDDISEMTDPFGDHRRQSAMDVPADLHAALKINVKYNALGRAYYLANRFRRNELASQGKSADEIDKIMSTDREQDALLQRAGVEVQAAVSQQKNAIAQKVGGWIQEGRKAGGFSGVAANVADTLVPVRSVPLNLLDESMEYNFGALRSAGLIKKAWTQGADKLTPDEADYVARNLNRNALGVTALGLFASGLAQMGSYYMQGDKNKDQAVGEEGIKVGDMELPKVATEHPLLTGEKLLATYQQARAETNKYGEPSHSAIGAAGTAASAYANTLPFINTVTGLQRAVSSEKNAAKYAGNTVAGIAIPGALSAYASAADPINADEHPDSSTLGRMFMGIHQDETRKPQSADSSMQAFLDAIKTHIPGYREDVTTAVPYRPRRH